MILTKTFPTVRRRRSRRSRRRRTTMMSCPRMIRMCKISDGSKTLVHSEVDFGDDLYDDYSDSESEMNTELKNIRY